MSRVCYIIVDAHTLRVVGLELALAGGVVLIGQQSGATARPVSKQMPTIAGAGAIRLVEPFLLPPEGYYRGNTAKSLDRPMPTITASHGGDMRLVEPYLITTDQTGSNGACAHRLGKPLPTVVTKQNMILVQPMVMKFYGTGRCKSLSEPLDTVTTKDRFMLVECKTGRTVAELDIRTRMLQPHELAAAHSFPKTYQFTGNKEDQTMQIGNSVPIELACAHARALV